MSSKKNHRSRSKQHRLEQLEQRIALTAQAVTDVAEAPGPQPQQQVEITTLLKDVNQASGIQYVHENYGFSGEGQTVAVVDSGIAWDHLALGGGYGEGYQVVGGWDFAENDANPYDDGPAGYHGTHVAGIIGSGDDVHTGVASGTDLVALRVFDDMGRSNFDWIESALRWVHEHKDDYANPITTVNLSLGVAWNADNVPEWAQLEDEFALLKEDGIFISVAAGNSFQQYQNTGLSYPAASPHVVPVASHDANGAFSNFSQRNDRVLVAPGQDIFSTVPDHLYGGAATDQFLKGSGTSMAAPYVAGSSTLVREAFEFMGQNDLTQDEIYQHFQDTATRFYDSTTNQWYDRINMRAAIDSIVTDQHADTFASATDLGRLSDTLTASGTIGKFSDVDAFSFVADADGTVTLEFSQTHDLATKFSLSGNTFEINGNQITFDVVSGQEYQFSMETMGGIGHYSLDLSLEASSQNNVDATDWGVVSDSNFSTGVIQGESWFRVVAQQDGIVSAIGNLSGQDGLRFEFYDANQNHLASSQSHAGSVRLDSNFMAGQEFYLKVIGNSENIDVRMLNLVHLDAGNLSIDGTEDADRISVKDVRGHFEVTINDVAYQFQRTEVENVSIHAGGGADHLDLGLGSTNDQMTLAPNSADVTNSDYTLAARGFTSITVRNIGGGTDRAILEDSAGNDWLSYNYFQTRFAGAEFTNQLYGFTDITVNGSQGFDYAGFQGSTLSDSLRADGTSAEFGTSNRAITVNDFDRLYVNGGGGEDRFEYQGAQGNEHFIVNEHLARVYSENSVVIASGFEDLQIDGGAGNDTLRLKDSASKDSVLVSEDRVQLSGGYSFVGENLEQVSIASSHGDDTVTIHGTSGADHVKMTPTETTLKSETFQVSTEGFRQVVVDAGQQPGDTLEMIGSAGADRVYWMAQQTVMIGQGFQNRAIGFENATLDTQTGYDSVYITGSSESEQLTVTREKISWEGETFQGKVNGAERVRVLGNGANDRAVMEGFKSDDRLQARQGRIQANLDTLSVFLQEFGQVDAYAFSGETPVGDVDAVDFVFNQHGDWVDE